MFSSGNGTEKQRMGRICKEGRYISYFHRFTLLLLLGDVVLDLYAGIGYFTLPFLILGLLSSSISDLL